VYFGSHLINGMETSLMKSYMTWILTLTLTLYLLTWKIWWAPNNASKGQMGFNSACKGLNMWRLPFRETSCRWECFPVTAGKDDVPCESIESCHSPQMVDM